MRCRPNRVWTSGLAPRSMALSCAPTRGALAPQSVRTDRMASSTTGQAREEGFASSKSATRAKILAASALFLPYAERQHGSRRHLAIPRAVDARRASEHLGDDLAATRRLHALDILRHVNRSGPDVHPPSDRPRPSSKNPGDARRQWYTRHGSGRRPDVDPDPGQNGKLGELARVPRRSAYADRASSRRTDMHASATRSASNPTPSVT